VSLNISLKMDITPNKITLNNTQKLEIRSKFKQQYLYKLVIALRDSMNTHDSMNGILNGFYIDHKTINSAYVSICVY